MERGGLGNGCAGLNPFYGMVSEDLGGYNFGRININDENLALANMKNGCWKLLIDEGGGGGGDGEGEIATGRGGRTSLSLGGVGIRGHGGYGDGFVKKKTREKTNGFSEWSRAANELEDSCYSNQYTRKGTNAKNGGSRRGNKSMDAIAKTGYAVPVGEELNITNTYSLNRQQKPAFKSYGPKNSKPKELHLTKGNIERLHYKFAVPNAHGSTTKGSGAQKNPSFKKNTEIFNTNELITINGMNKPKISGAATIPSSPPKINSIVKNIKKKMKGYYDAANSTNQRVGTETPGRFVLRNAETSNPPANKKIAAGKLGKKTAKRKNSEKKDESPADTKEKGFFNVPRRKPKAAAGKKPKKTVPAPFFIKTLNTFNRLGSEREVPLDMDLKDQAVDHINKNGFKELDIFRNNNLYKIFNEDQLRALTKNWKP